MFIIVTCNEDTVIRAAQCVTHPKYLHATVAIVLEVRGVNVVTIALKTAKFRCGYHCTSNHGTPYT